ncbi:hypothetical protein COS70_01705, partial [Candidatus Micrarchaeota archaeon CG06_land_8_20_14_3_00_50_6]
MRRKQSAAVLQVHKLLRYPFLFSQSDCTLVYLQMMSALVSPVISQGRHHLEIHKSAVRLAEKK